MSETTRVAAMLFVNAKGEVLLQSHDSSPEVVDSKQWSPIHATAETGETLEDALVRGVREALELTPEFEYWDTHESAGLEVAFFAARLDGGVESLARRAARHLQFFSPQAAMMQPLASWLTQVLPDFARSALYQRLCPDAMPPGNAEAASVVFVNREGELLLRLRGAQPGLPFPSMWDLIGGAMEEGETPEDAAVRETLEELGLVLEHFLYWGDVRGIVLVHVFMAPLDVAAESLELTEGERIEWFEPASALPLPLVPYMERLLPRFISTPPYSDLFADHST